MKRHLSLRPLSRDHCTGLHFANKLVRSKNESEEEKERTISRFLEAWRTELDEHFTLEERYLLPFMLGMPESNRLINEHSTLRAMVGVLENGTGNVRPAVVGEYLHDHIRWEERELFPKLENSLTEAELASLLAPLAEHEKAPEPSEPAVS